MWSIISLDVTSPFLVFFSSQYFMFTIQNGVYKYYVWLSPWWQCLKCCCFVHKVC